MPAIDSRQGPGTLTLGTLTGAGCQMTNVRLVPEAEEEDGLPTLCDPAPAPTNTTKWSLQGTAIQDWEKNATSGFVEFCRVNDNTTVTFDVDTEHGEGRQLRRVVSGAGRRDRWRCRGPDDD